MSPPAALLRQRERAPADGRAPEHDPEVGARRRRTRGRFAMVAFVVAEVLLVVAIPFVAIRGYHTLLDSRAGRLIEEPTRTDPGWRALVDATTIIGIAEVDGDRVTGVSLLIHHPELRTSGAVVLVPGTVEVDGAMLADRPPHDAVQTVGRALRLSVDRVEVLDDAAWGSVLGDQAYQLDSPDPVLADDGSTLFGVGPVVVDGSNAAAFAGRPAPGTPAVSVLPRRHLLWTAVLDEPPETATPLAADLRRTDAEEAQVVDLPVTSLEPPVTIDGAESEALVRDVVAFPAGFSPGDRLQVRIIDRTGTADLEAIAAAVAARGLEVTEIGNAAVFDGGPTEVIAPATLTAEEGPLRSELDGLSRAVGASSVIVDHEAASEGGDDAVVTVIVGSDFDLANLDRAGFIDP